MTSRILIALVIAMSAALAVWMLTTRSAPIPPTHRLTPPAGIPALPAELASDGPLVSWSADTHARFEPCGCVAGMYGGLSRRAALLARVAPGRLLAVELGGWSAGAADHERLRTDAYLRGLAIAGIAALGLGRREIALGAEVLTTHLAAARTAGIPIVVANVTRSDGAPFIEPVVRVRAGGRTFAVTSVVPADARGAGLTVRDPADALASLLANDGGDPLIVLADLDENSLADLARAAPGVALVIGGAVTSPTDKPLAIGAVRVIHAANHGKLVGWWAWGSDACSYELIADALPQQPELVAIASEHQRHLGEVALLADVLDQPAPSAAAYAGPASCTSCHAQAAQIHGASKHARAFAALEHKSHQNDPDCLRCHVTGLDRTGGFRRKQPGPALDAVTCESCHGPASLHVAAALRGEPRTAPLIPVSAATCATCHDGENSPKFRYDDYWRRIVHGK